MLDLKFVTTAKEAKEYVEKGYTPVECSFGAESVVDGNGRFDHHGTLEHLPPVVKQVFATLIANADGSFTNPNPQDRFVVTGAPDADATLAIWMLHQHDIPKYIELPKYVELVAKKDAGTRGLRLSESPEGIGIILWGYAGRQLPQTTSDVRFMEGVFNWDRLFKGNLETFRGVAVLSEQERINAAKEAESLAIFAKDGLLVMVNPKVPGFDVWYDRYDVVLAYLSSRNNITIGCRDEEAAASKFGEGGLKNIYNKLSEKLGDGWGGRSTVGGSPRGKAMQENDLKIAADIVMEAMGITIP